MRVAQAPVRPPSSSQQAEAALTYHKTVLQAWHEVVNAIAALRLEQVRRALAALLILIAGKRSGKLTITAGSSDAAQPIH